MLSPVDTWIEKIASLQSGGGPEVPEGLFPTFRSNPLIGYRRPDLSLFFSSVTAFTLQSLLAAPVKEETRARIRKIVAGVARNYPDFRNKDGLPTYNFWKTRPSGHFRKGRLLHRWDHFRIPDDADDTALVYLTTCPSDEEKEWLKHKLTLHANGAKQRIRNTYPEYRDLAAYSTWFGRKMYIEFDACVLSNLLYCIFFYNMPLNRHDEDSLAYIRSVIGTGRFMEAPFRCAHHYPRSPLIVYHVARLMGAFDPPALRPVKSRLIAGAWALLEAADHPMDRIVLSTSLLRLGERPSYIDARSFGPAEFGGFYFFIAGLMTAYEHPLLYRLAGAPIFHMYWTCEAHCWALLAEYETCYREAGGP